MCPKLINTSHVPETADPLLAKKHHKDVVTSRVSMFRYSSEIGVETTVDTLNPVW